MPRDVAAGASDVRALHVCGTKTAAVEQKTVGEAYSSISPK